MQVLETRRRLSKKKHLGILASIYKSLSLNTYILDKIERRRRPRNNNDKGE